MSVALAQLREGDDGASEAPELLLQPSPRFAEWLAARDASLCVSTYQAGKLFLIGGGIDGRLSVFERTVNRCMGVATTADSIYIATQWQLWRMENALARGQVQGGYDAVYVPQVGTVTGAIDVHDLAVDDAGRVIFVNTLFSCLAAPSDSHSFRPLWRPPFITALAPEDRCHLNGLALRDGEPAYVTAVAPTDTAEGWRDCRRDGGCVIDIKSNEVCADGLSMPHSPRWHDGKLWLHNSGTGEFGYIDMARGGFEPLCFCPGFLRGLALGDGYAVLGVSRPRGGTAFGGLALDDALARFGITAQCAVMVVDLESANVVHWLTFAGVVDELYDIAILPGVCRPMMIGFQGDDIHRVISIE